MQFIPSIKWSGPKIERGLISWNGLFHPYGNFTIEYWEASDEVDVRYLGSYPPLKDGLLPRQKLGRHYSASRFKNTDDEVLDFAFRYGKETINSFIDRAADNGAFDIGLIKALVLRLQKRIERD